MAHLISILTSTAESPNYVSPKTWPTWSQRSRPLKVFGLREVASVREHVSAAVKRAVAVKEGDDQRPGEAGLGIP
eukprot:748881-Pyramimonas_sp.AAC.1